MFLTNIIHNKLFSCFSFFGVGCDFIIMRFDYIKIHDVSLTSRRCNFSAEFF